LVTSGPRRGNDRAVEQRQGDATAPYRSRDPAKSVLYRVVQSHFEADVGLCTEGDGEVGALPGYVERELRRYLDWRFLSRLLLPRWQALPEETRQGLTASSAARNRVGLTVRVAGIYGVNIDMLWRHATLDWRRVQDGARVLGDAGGQARDHTFGVVASTQVNQPCPQNA
jgi:hypothetical protein